MADEHIDILSDNIENAEELIEEAGDINEELGGKEFDKREKESCYR